MYNHYSLTLAVGQARHREMVAAAERARLVRRAKSLARVAAPPRTQRRVRHLLRQLRPQAQS
jgi:hypothetical protein